MWTAVSRIDLKVENCSNVANKVVAGRGNSFCGRFYGSKYTLIVRLAENSKNNLTRSSDGQVSVQDGIIEGIVAVDILHILSKPTEQQVFAAEVLPKL